MKNHYLDINNLKSNFRMIHYFGLGFIQLKLDHHNRIHFYTSKLPAIVPDEDIHNHRYDFHSKVLMGSLSQEIYQVIECDGDYSGNYVREKESCNADVKCDEPGVPCEVKLLSTQTFSEGSHYWVDHGTFHKVHSTHCVTMLTRSDYKKDLADVVRPAGEAKVCPFSKKIEPEELWAIVEEMLK
jgi:hypothetical protein